MTSLHTVRVLNCDGVFDVPEDVTILEAARSAGLPFPYGCRIGRCGACKSRLLSGEVEHLAHTPFSLTMEDRKRGLILACRARPRNGCTVAWLGSDAEQPPVQQMSGRVASISRPVADVAIIRIAVDGEPLGFNAGQYVELGFEGCPSRTYSMANHPRDPLLEFHVRLMPGGVVGCHVANRLRPGDAVQFQGPMGNAHLRLRRTGAIIAAAGGTGLAPILSILRVASGFRLGQTIRLFLFGRDEDSFYGLKDIEALAPTLPDFTCVRLIGPRSARLEAFAAALPGLAGASAYVAGSPALVDATSAILSSRGLLDEHIFADAFVTSAELQAAHVG